MKKIARIIAITLVAISSQAMAKDSVVKCQIDGNNDSGKLEALYKGSCVFAPYGKNGSFLLANPEKNKNLTPNVISITVDIIKKDEAEVRGLTTDGINSRWGEAKRSESNKACWEGSDFKVCAW